MLEEIGSVHLQQAVRTIAVAKAELASIDAATGRGHMKKRLKTVAVFRMHCLEHVPSDQFLDCVAEDPLDCGAHVFQATFGTDNHDHVGDAVGEKTKVLFARS